MKALLLGLSVFGLFSLASVESAEARGGWYGEAAYLRCNPDVRRAVWRGEFRSGWEHYQRHGRYENRITDGNCFGRRDRIPGWFDEHGYLRCNPDVQQAVWRGEFRSGYHHYLLHGQYENRRFRCWGR